MEVPDDGRTGVRCDAVLGCLLGTAVGDAIGLPYEGLSPRRAAKLLGPPTRHRLLFGRGMISDDTEHAVMVAQALAIAGGDPEVFARALARGLRRWMLGLPGGVGLATLKAIVRLWLGVPPRRSGVFSAGNGPAMRAPILGAASSDLDAMVALVEASSRMTHTDPRAEHGARAVALAAHLAARGKPVSPEAFARALDDLLPESAVETRTAVHRAVDSALAGETTQQLAAAMGLGRGVTGFVLHSVPIALHAWMRHQDDFRAAIEAVVRCGGDADSTAAITGGVAGAGIGNETIPRAWIDGLLEWPYGVGWIEGVARGLGNATPSAFPIVTRWPRNALFLTVVLTHGMRRLLPPY